MSRIGKLPIQFDSGVKISIADDSVSVQGPKGALSHALPFGISAKIEEQELRIERSDDSKQQRSLHGLVRALLANAVQGVTRGFERDLEIHGVGYRAEVAGKVVKFTLGYTHPIEFPIPEGIQIAVERNTRIKVSGCDRQQVGQVAADLRALRPPDVYKLKGVRYANERLRKKAGKSGVK
jgi:large subunit ribosomal protein L6